MKILIDAASQFGRPGGERRLRFHLARSLAEFRGLEVAIVLDAEEPEAVRTSFGSAGVLMDASRAARDAFSAFRSRRALRSAVQTFAPEVQLVSPDRVLARRVPVLSTLRTLPSSDSWTRPAPGLFEAQHILVSSAFLRATAAARWPMLAESLVLLREGIDLAQFGAGEDPRDGLRLAARGLLRRGYLLCVGAFDGDHGTALAIAVREDLARLGFDLPLVLVGHGHQLPEEDLAALTAAHFQQRAGIVLRGVADQELATLYRCAEAVLCPAPASGAALVPLEALAAGASVLVADQPVHRERLGLAPVRWLPADIPSAWTEAVIQGLALPRYSSQFETERAEVLLQSSWYEGVRRLLDLLMDLRAKRTAEG